jgi:hypothetical protein
MTSRKRQKRAKQRADQLKELFSKQTEEQDYIHHNDRLRVKTRMLSSDPYDKARRIILFLGAASLVMGVAKLFGAKDNTGDKNQ